MRTPVAVAVLHLVALAIVVAPGASPTEAAQTLQIVPASPSVYCLFSNSPDCGVARTDTQATFALDGTTGSGVLRTSTFKASPGSPADGWWGYEYQVDLSGVEGILAPNCIDAMRIPLGGVSLLFDLDGNGTAGEQVYLVGAGAAVPTFALRDGPDVTFYFEPPVCTGETTVTVGVVGGKPPHGVLADLQPEQGSAFQAGARAPELPSTVVLGKLTGLYMVVAVLPPGSIPGPPKIAEGRRQLMLDRIREAMGQAEDGHMQGALGILQGLRTRLDGVGDDWVLDDLSTRLDEQVRVLTVLDDAIAALMGR